MQNVPLLSTRDLNCFSLFVFQKSIYNDNECPFMLCSKVVL